MPPVAPMTSSLPGMVWCISQKRFGAGPGEVRIAEQQAAAVGRRVAAEGPAVRAEFAAVRVVVEAVVPDFCGCLLQIDRRLAHLRNRRCGGQHCHRQRSHAARGSSTARWRARGPPSSSDAPTACRGMLPAVRSDRHRSGTGCSPRRSRARPTALPWPVVAAARASASSSMWKRMKRSIWAFGTLPRPRSPKACAPRNCDRSPRSVSRCSAVWQTLSCACA